ARRKMRSCVAFWRSEILESGDGILLSAMARTSLMGGSGKSRRQGAGNRRGNLPLPAARSLRRNGRRRVFGDVQVRAVLDRVGITAGLRAAVVWVVDHDGDEGPGHSGGLRHRAQAVFAGPQAHCVAGAAKGALAPNVSQGGGVGSKRL